MTLFPEDPKKKPKTRTLHGLEVSAIVAETALHLKRRGMLPMDRGLKSIFASQVGVLLKEGYDAVDVRRAAIDIATSDNYNPRRLAYIALRVRQTASRAAEDEHHRRKLSEESPPDNVVSILPKLKRIE